MLRGLYAAANAMRYRANEVETVANNLANVTTDGYKRDRIAVRSFGDLLMSRIEAAPEETLRMQAIPPQVGVMNLGGPIGETEFIDFSPGAPRVTGNPLDIFIEGPGFFAINTPNGERYTRAGSFTLDSEGKIVTQSGFEVQDASRNAIRITSPAPININQDGTITQDGIPVAQLRLVEFPDLTALEKEGGTLFVPADPNAVPVPAVNSAVEQGTIEGSNVNAINSLVNLITAQRAYEAAARAVDMFNQSLSRVSGEIGRIPV